ncbi:MAG: hypothetical protein R3B96_23615 [Pirellulaceae bacterium]
MRAREGITLNMFLVPSWSQSEEDIHFAIAWREQLRDASSSRQARITTALSLGLPESPPRNVS